MSKMTTKHIKRIIRVLRLLAVVQAYHHYTMMQLYHKSLQHENSWENAERLSDLMNFFMPYKECTPSDFLRDEDKDTNEILDNYEGFKKWAKVAETMCVSEKTLMAFCKNVDNLQSVFQLKAFGHVFYPDWLKALFLYLNNDISKTELQNTFVKYSLFTGKPEPANLAEFRKVIIEIEAVISQITIKQINRNIGSVVKSCF